MALYKGIDYPGRVAPLARHMDALDEHREALAALGASWDTLALLTHLSDLKIDMDDVRASFGRLAAELLAGLADETLDHALRRLGHPARIAADLLARNLAERAAGTAFFATDGPVVEACLAPDPARLTALRERLRLYAGRYTVYRDAILMDTGGQVLCRLRDGFDARSSSPVVARALQAAGGVVESMDAADFCGETPALTHAARVEHAGRAVGVLVLEFDLAREAASIFDRLAGEDTLLAFIDGAGHVIVSNDPARLRPGQAAPGREGEVATRLAGMTYLFVRQAMQPAQGHAGPAWSAIALMPADQAFQPAGDAGVDLAFSGETVFSPRLREMPGRARDVQRRLDRLVWNGRVGAADDADDFSRALLREIAATGRRTKDVFERACGQMLGTVTAGLLADARFLAAMAVDILDRNLYERANDCRWWAASPVLASADGDAARRVLARLDALYPACANIVLFDGTGRVVAASRDTGAEGCALLEPWVVETLALRDPMAYAVSAFEVSDLHGDAPTFIYAAPLLDGGRAFGGVGLVLDSAAQFDVMLRTALARMPGAIGAFCRRDGTFLARTGELPLALPAQVLALAPGESWSGVLEESGHCHVVGAAAGRGYREFKTSDGHDDTIIGVTILPCGKRTAQPPETPAALARVDGGTEVATFLIGSQLAGIEAREVIECIEVAQAVRVWRGGFAKRHVGFATWNGIALPLIDAGAELGAAGAPHRHAIVLRAGAQMYGLLVSELGPVAAMSLLEERGLAGLHDPSKLIAQLARAGSLLIPVLSPAALFSASA